MGTRKKIIILLVVLALVGVLIFIYKENKSRINTLPNSLTTENNTTTPVIDKAKQEEFEQAIKKVASTDQDFDGLPDSEEVAYKTDPASADTDGDGLTDWQEISIYTSDPLKADTDGDTFSDGYEVRHGFSPKGKGTL